MACWSSRALTVWQVRAITGSRYPGLRAAQALGLIVPLYLLLFASTYFLMERASAANFTQPLTRTDALYFSVTVFTTVGFGDIAAKSETARVVLIVQMLADLALLGAGARVLLGAVRRGQQRRIRAYQRMTEPPESLVTEAVRSLEVRWIFPGQLDGRGGRMVRPVPGQNRITRGHLPAGSAVARGVGEGPRRRAS